MGRLEVRLLMVPLEVRRVKGHLEGHLLTVPLEGRRVKGHLEGRLGMDPLVGLLKEVQAHHLLHLQKLHHNVDIRCRFL